MAARSRLCGSQWSMSSRTFADRPHRRLSRRPVPARTPRVYDATRRLWVIAAILAFGAGVVAERVHTYAEPIERDIAGYAVIGHEMLRGRHLYTDLWERKPPLLYATFAAAERLTRYGPAEVFTVNVAAALATLLGCYAAGRAGGGTSAGLVAAGLWVLLGGDPLHLGEPAQRRGVRQRRPHRRVRPAGPTRRRLAVGAGDRRAVHAGDVLRAARRRHLCDAGRRLPDGGWANEERPRRGVGWGGRLGRIGLLPRRRRPVARGDRRALPRAAARRQHRRELPQGVSAEQPAAPVHDVDRGARRPDPAGHRPPAPASRGSVAAGSS